MAKQITSHHQKHFLMYVGMCNFLNYKNGVILNILSCNLICDLEIQAGVPEKGEAVMNTASSCFSNSCRYEWAKFKGLKGSVRMEFMCWGI